LLERKSRQAFMDISCKLKCSYYHAVNKIRDKNEFKYSFNSLHSETFPG
jgi:hypothetical protein